MKSKISTKYYQNGSKVEPKYVVEIQTTSKGPWYPLADDDGVKKFNTKAEAEVEEFKVMKPQGARLANLS